ncbi:MAG: zinc-ribbon domain-containing protein [Pseudomonadota bacterium]|nr:zinc-ribbon domain-containing protein [Pseudomonadota bacterium]MEE3069848.1 zinc-ribbon domain-containing protein [Pseudomonadota bacterium]
MRLTCPNCGAIYEVPDNVIPEDGRDVQCSNCAVTWFQHPAGWEEPEDDLPADEAASDTPEETVQATGTEPEPLPQDPSPAEEPEPVPAQQDPLPQDAPDEAPLPEDPVPADTPQEDPSETAAPEADDAAGPEDLEPEELLARLEAAEAAAAEAPAEEAPSMPPVAAAAATPTRRELDPAIRDLLREEAEYESQMRAKDKQADPIETQPDLGLTDPPRRRVIRVERHKIDDQDAPEAQPEAVDEESTPEKPSNSRRDLLPDIEDINSTLRGRDRLQGPTTVGELMEDPEETRSGFRSGFFLTVLFALVLGAVYLQSTPLSKAMPAAAPTLQNYVENVDQARGWLDTRARGVVTWLDSFSSEAAETKE